MAIVEIWWLRLSIKVATEASDFGWGGHTLDRAVKTFFFLPFSTMGYELWEKGKSGNGGLEGVGAMVLLRGFGLGNVRGSEMVEVNRQLTICTDWTL